MTKRPSTTIAIDLGEPDAVLTEAQKRRGDINQVSDVRSLIGVVTSLVEPGEKNGPCVERCHHPRCKTLRQLVSHICPGCFTKLGTKRLIIPGEDGQGMHLYCSPERVRETHQNRQRWAEEGRRILLEKSHANRWRNG